MVATQVSGLVISAVINIALTILCFVLYSVFRKQPGNAGFYFSRPILKEKKAKTRAHFSLESFIPSAGWVKEAWQLSEDEILEISGLDAIVYLRIFVFCFRFFGICTVLGLFVLVPLNYIQGAVDIDTITTDALDKFTISNVTDGSNRLWVHFSILYLISFLAYGLLYLEYSYVARKRVDFLRNTQPQLDQFTVLLHAIPTSSQQTYSEQIDDFFSTYYPDMYLLHHMVYDDQKLQKLLGEAQWLMREVEFLKSIAATERVPQRTGCIGLFGSKEDPLDLYLKRLEELLQNIKESQLQFVQRKRDLPVSFVSFKMRWGAAVAAQTQQTPNPLQWVTESAPEPRDVNWRGLSIPFTQLWILRLLVGVAFFCLTVLFFIPAGLVYTLATLQNLMTWFPFITTILSIPVVSSFINGYLPSLLLTILYYFIPPLMLFLTQMEGYPSRSTEDRKTCGKVFLFLVGNSFFLVTYGSLTSLINVAIDSPTQIPTLLASAVSGQGNFFMNFIMTKGWTGFAIEILQPYILMAGFTWRHVCRKRQYGPYVQSLNYYRALPNVLLFVFIGFMYAILAPLLLPFLMIYLMLGYIVYRNQILNVYEPAYETGGRYWPHVHNRIISSIFLMQLICVGMFGVKSKASASTFSIPLLAVTLLFSHYCNMRFYPVFCDLPVQMIKTKDKEDEEKGLKEGILQSLEKAYACPSLQPIDMNIPGSSNYEPLLSSQQHYDA